MTTVATVQFASAALGRQVTYTVLLPTVGAPPWPVLYQLHGWSDDHRAWLERSNLQRHLAALPLLVVLPDGGTSYWANVHPLMRYEGFVVDDLDAHVRSTFRVRDGKAAIGGLSMGGYGALRLGLRHPDRFASVWAHSSRVPRRAELAGLSWAKDLVAAGESDALDLEVILDRALASGPLPRLALDCGTDDHLIEDSRRLHAALTRRGVAHHWAEHPGAHTWDYWDAHVPEALAFHARALGVAGIDGS